MLAGSSAASRKQHNRLRQFRWFPAPKAATVILFFHANAEAILRRRLHSDSPWIDRLQCDVLRMQDLGMSFAILKHMRDQFKAAT